ncbi:MAG: energy transducer TonB [Proteobacteria bacterium]|nr:energy transducer TonB [Pseudomonadota bacterium]
MLGLLAAVVIQGAGLPPNAGVSVITNPDWRHGPSGADLIRSYPKAALAAHLEGRAVLHCGVAATGDLMGCRVVSEDPAGYGFGEAALSLAPKFKMKPQLRDGAPTSEGQINLPIHFSLPTSRR